MTSTHESNNRRRKTLSEHQVRMELETKISKAGGVNALAREAGINIEPIIRARKGGAIRPAVLKMLRLRKSQTTYERISEKDFRRRNG
jgi:hypothetical protein